MKATLNLSRVAANALSGAIGNQVAMAVIEGTPVTPEQLKELTDHAKHMLVWAARQRDKGVLHPAHSIEEHLVMLRELRTIVDNESIDLN